MAARCRTGSNRRCRTSPTAGAHRLRRAHRYRRARAEPGRAPRRAGERDPSSWVRGTQPLPAARHRRAVVPPGGRGLPRPQPARAAAATATCCCESPVRPALETGLVGWSLPAAGRRRDARRRQHCCSASTTSASFRAAACQAATPGEDAARDRHPAARRATGASTSTPAPSCTTWCATSWAAWWRSAAARQPPGWMAEVLAARRRDAAAPTFAADGLYFVGPYYDAGAGPAGAHGGHGLAALTPAPRRTAPASRSAA